LPTWQPDPTLLGELAAETIIEGNRIRPPKGYQYQQKEGTIGVMHGWAALEDGTERISVFAIELASLQPNDLSTAQAVLDGLFVSIKRNTTDLQESGMERGLIGGIPFIRRGWTATYSKTARKKQGFIYVGRWGRDLVILSGTEDFGGRSSLPLAEAAARTFSPH
jgi:hypothetical protein